MIHLITTEQTFEVRAAREALSDDCKLAQRFQCDHFEGMFDLEGYLEAVEGLAGRPAAAMAAWLSNGYGVESFHDAYQGEWVSELAFTEDLVDECGMLSTMPEHLRGYFDYTAFSRDIFINDYTYLDGYVFINC